MNTNPKDSSQRLETMGDTLAILKPCPGHDWQEVFGPVRKCRHCRALAMYKPHDPAESMKIYGYSNE